MECSCHAYNMKMFHDALFKHKRKKNNEEKITRLKSMKEKCILTLSTNVDMNIAWLSTYASYHALGLVIELKKREREKIRGF